MKEELGLEETLVLQQAQMRWERENSEKMLHKSYYR
jgi:hypothetical protein